MEKKDIKGIQLGKLHIGDRFKFLNVESTHYKGEYTLVEKTSLSCEFVDGEVRGFASKKCEVIKLKRK